MRFGLLGKPVEVSFLQGPCFGGNHISGHGLHQSLLEKGSSWIRGKEPQHCKEWQAHMWSLSHVPGNCQKEVTKPAWSSEKPGMRILESTLAPSQGAPATSVTTVFMKIMRNSFRIQSWQYLPCAYACKCPLLIHILKEKWDEKSINLKNKWKWIVCILVLSPILTSFKA